MDLETLIAVLTLRSGHNSAVVVLGAACLGIAGGTVGTFLLLRRRALVSDALAHATLPGLAVGFLVAVAVGLPGRTLPILLGGAVVSAILGALAIQALGRWSRLPEDAATAVVLSVFFGLGTVLVSWIQTLSVAGQAGLKTFLLGQTAAMQQGEAMAIAALALAGAAACALLFKEFRVVCFDPGFARAQGWPVGAIDLVLMALVTFVTVIGLQTVGLVLIVAFLIVPAAAARFWTDRLTTMLVVAGAIGAASGWIGATLSALLPRMPAGAVIVLTAGVFFAASALFAPARGILAAAMRRGVRRLAVARALWLRAALAADAAGRAGPGGPGMMLERLAGRVDGGGRLTPAGREAAMAAERDARLWDRFVTDYPTLLPDHADWGFGPVERFLPADLVRELEGRVRWS
jgi:manganese/zinc/iron transport system permease protein